STSMVKVRSKQYLVENKDPNGSRQPTLIIRPVMANGLLPSSSNGKSQPLSWIDGFYAEVAKLAADSAMQRLEAHALRAVAEELQSAASHHPAILAATLIGSYLAMSEQLCRGQDQDRAGMYALALRGLGRLLPEPATEDAVGWGKPNLAGR